eukprot:gene31677-38282_t
MSVEYYRTTDPLENFYLRVVVREISRPKNQHNDPSIPPPPFFNFDKSIRWQQKLVSPMEIAYYIAHKSQQASVALMHRTAPSLFPEAHSIISKLERDGVNPSTLLTDPLVYTYTHADPPLPEDSLIKQTGFLRDKDDLLGEKRAFKKMSICMATKIDKEKLLHDVGRGLSVLKEGNYYYTETVLVTLRVYPDGLVEASPALSHPVLEPPQSLPPDLGVQYFTSAASAPPPHPSPLSVFLDDRSVREGARGGFPLSLHRVRGGGGGEFEVGVVNKGETLSPLDTERFIARQRLLDAVRSRDNMGVGLGWRQGDVSKGKRLVCLMGEIVSAEGFDAGAGGLFLTYELCLPPGAQLRKGLGESGPSHTTSPSTTLAADDPDGAEFGCLRGATHVSWPVSALSPGLPVRLSAHRWVSAPRSAIAGGVYFLVSVTAVVVGLDYLIVVVLALGLLFVCCEGGGGEAAYGTNSSKSHTREGVASKGRYMNYQPLSDGLRRIAGAKGGQSALFNLPLSVTFETSDALLATPPQLRVSVYGYEEGWRVPTPL